MMTIKQNDFTTLEETFMTDFIPQSIVRPRKLNKYSGVLVSIPNPCKPNVYLTLYFGLDA